MGYRYILKNIKHKLPAEYIVIERNLSTLKDCLFFKKEISPNFSHCHNSYNQHLIEILITEN